VGGGAVVLCLPSCARLGHALPDELLVLLRELRQDLDQRPAHGSQVSHVAKVQAGLLRMPGVHSRLKGDHAQKRADVVLRPDVGHDRWVDFRNPRQYIQAGREAALRQIDEIKALVQEKGTTYEHQPAPESLAAIA